MYRHEQAARLMTAEKWVSIAIPEEGTKWYFMESEGRLLSPQRLFDNYDYAFVPWAPVIEWAERNTPEDLYRTIRNAYDRFEETCWDAHLAQEEKDMIDAIYEDGTQPDPYFLPSPPSNLVQHDWNEINMELNTTLDKMQQDSPMSLPE